MRLTMLSATASREAQSQEGAHETRETERGRTADAETCAVRERVLLSEGDEAAREAQESASAASAHREDSHAQVVAQELLRHALARVLDLETDAARAVRARDALGRDDERDRAGRRELERVAEQVDEDAAREGEKGRQKLNRAEEGVEGGGGGRTA